jgi:class 3 adenylate cyclase/tetratricopeptide (TPR) repeat protein
VSSEQKQLIASIATLEAQRALLGDAVVDASVAALRSKLLALTTTGTGAESAAQTLRQVSILFLDVVGSTALSQHLDPEEIQAVMDGALARYTAIVESHRGKVLQYAGDSLLAVFGADEAREDDPERAVHAGLALLQEGRHQGELVKRQHGRDGFSIRVGLHTGSVLLGGGVDAEGSIRGIAVSIAARMEQSAPPGTLRISHDTYRHVRGLFEVEAQPVISLKGLDEPFVSYLVLRAKPRPFRVTARGIEGVETRMIGREVELALLCDNFERLFIERQLTAVAVIAEAGVGKSRLLYEFGNWSEARSEQFHLFQGRASPQTQANPYGLLRDIFARWLQIADDDTLQAARQKIELGIAPLFVQDDGEDLAEGHAHLLGHLIGLDLSASHHISGIRDDPRQIRNRAFHTAAQTFRRLSAQDGKPVVLQLEDLHWADDATLDFLSYLAEVNRDVAMLILGFARPTLFERRLDWLGTQHSHRRIDLSPLDKAQSHLLAAELLQKLPTIPSAVSELIIGRAEGNPFYMEELIKMLVDQGAIEIGSMSWSLHLERLLATHVPPTLTGVLQARLDSLPALEKQVLQEASVIGPIFWDQPLASLDARAHELLPALERRELALPSAEAAVEGLREYAFRHQILHQVTYDTVLKRARRDLHGKVARWFSELTGSRANDFLGMTAWHYEEAGDAINAAEYHARAAEQIRDRFAHDGVLNHVQRALALLDRVSGAETASLRWRLLEVREQTLDLQGMRSEQRADIDSLQMLAETMSDDRRRAYASFRRSDLADRTADSPTCEGAARHAMALACTTGDHELRLRAQRLIALARRACGDFESAKTLARQGLTEARERGLKGIESAFLDTLAGTAGMQDDMLDSLELGRQSLRINRETRDRRGEARALGNLGASWLGLGDFEQATRDLEESTRLARAIGDRATECNNLINLAQVSHWQGDLARALAFARAALDIGVAAQMPDAEIFARFLLGDAEVLQGNGESATEAYQRAWSLASEISSPLQHNATAGLIQVALARGDTATALEQVEGLLAQMATGDALGGADSPRLIELTCYRVLARTGDARAMGLLQSTYEALKARADTLPDAALRQSFLTRIPHHREIVETWRTLDQDDTKRTVAG